MFQMFRSGLGLVRVAPAAVILVVALAAPARAADPNRPGAYDAPSLENGRDAAALDAAARARIRGVISSQIEAFRRDDAAAAFSYASPGIQARFGDPATFIEMVKSGYAAIYRPAEVAFKDVRMLDGRPAQLMHFVGLDGAAVDAIYLMERQPDGSWRIAGVYIVSQPGSAA